MEEIIQPSTYMVEQLRRIRLLKEGKIIPKPAKIKKKEFPAIMCEIINLITNNTMNSIEISEKVGVCPRTVKNYLYKLKEGIPTDPFLELTWWKGKGKRGIIYYRIVKKGWRRYK